MDWTLHESAEHRFSDNDITCGVATLQWRSRSNAGVRLLLIDSSTIATHAQRAVRSCAQAALNGPIEEHLNGMP